MALQQAKVKSVNSGDTLVLTSVNNPSQERMLSLAFVTAPRLRKDGDEPFAFESRDYLRRMVVGKVVQFQILYTISPPKGKQIELGRVLLPSSGTSLPEQAVADGWLKVRDNAGRSEDSDEATALLDRLRIAENKARSESKGVWATGGGHIDVAQDLSDPKGFVEQHKEKPLDAIIEKVLSGDRLIVRMILAPNRHLQTVLLIAGIRAPVTKRVNPSDGKEQAAQPGGEKSQRFVEERILQRNVKITVLGLSPQSQLIGTVQHPNGSIAEFVLKAGLAWCNDFHTTLLGANMGALRKAEESAKQAKLELFTEHVTARSKAGGDVEAVVARIQSADTIYLRNKAGGEKRVNLSSVRQPKPSDPKQAPFAAEAKEFLRKRLIGKTVRVVIDAKRPAQDGYEEREMATLTLNNSNVALLLVENGWVSVIRHRRDDADRSDIYDELLIAEQEAQKAQKGIWNPKPPTSARAPLDLSESVQKAKIQLSTLQRQKKIPAIVDFVKSGSRFTIILPRDNTKLTLVLSGIRTPRSARGPKEEGGEPFGQAAHDFASKRCNQRDVEIEIENVDKSGGFIGSLYVNRESFAKLLVEEGLASVHAYSAEQSGSARELLAAEQRAKDARKNLWKEWDPSHDAAEHDGNGDVDGDGDNASRDLSNSLGMTSLNGNGTAVPRAKNYRDVLITSIDPDCHLRLQHIGPGTTALTELMRLFSIHHASSTHAPPVSSPSSTPATAPKTGDHVSARFTEDKVWYRARILHNNHSERSSEVLYLDYGNMESLPWTSLRTLGPAFNTQKLAPQAIEAILSWVQFPATTSDYLHDARDWLLNRLAGRELVANVDREEGASSGGAAKVWRVTLFDPERSESGRDSINAELVAEGWATLARSLRPWERADAEMMELLRKKEGEAREGRKGMWEYGDLTED